MKDIARKTTLCSLLMGMVRMLHAVEVTVNSVERWTQISDHIFVGEVRSVDSVSSRQDGKLITFASRQILKGDADFRFIEWIENGENATVQTGEVAVELSRLWPAASFSSQW